MHQSMLITRVPLPSDPDDSAIWKFLLSKSTPSCVSESAISYLRVWEYLYFKCQNCPWVCHTPWLRCQKAVRIHWVPSGGSQWLVHYQIILLNNSKILGKWTLTKLWPYIVLTLVGPIWWPRLLIALNIICCRIRLAIIHCFTC